MNKKIIGTILCISMILIGSINAIGASPISTSKQNELLQQAIEVTEDENLTLGEKFIITMGPVSKLFSDVELLDGDASQIKIIERNLDRKLFRFSRFLPFIFVPVFGLNFTVHYKKALENGSKFSYITVNSSVVYDNETGEVVNVTNSTYVYNAIHKVKIENFTGIFIFQRARLYDRSMPLGKRFFMPARFIFFGFCDNVTYLPIAV